ncbi:DUF4214 domain-containing protein [Massilia sp. CFBP9012]|uniref:DUF4214 domain-containing protein n=1 Tax=Massilia sp. CFBP9012 TaxID=3096531 RepID=UPI002A6AB992|nr:DUF4214 domain-containing protein [Massilia sp. CFBP9012]MDY0978185.1 DUF4214 domain-containing protein [Massilia sp. CFBP9012]
MNELTSYESTVNSFYLAFYGRPADPAGLTFWAEQLANSNGDHRAIIDAFATSREAQVRFGDDTPAERIAEIYQQLFNRTPEQSGVDYWAEVVAQGQASLADVAIEILKGAQGTDKGLLELRQQAVDAFTTLVETSGSNYAGYSSIEAARVLVRAVTHDASQADIAQLVKATVAFADIASHNPAVIDAIATGSNLLALFDTARGKADPVILAQALADVAAAAAGSPATLESLLRGGGMAQVLKVMPADATLQDVVEALARGGLPAAIEVVYPSSPATPSPSAPVSSLKFDSVESGTGDRDLKDHVTKVESADVKFTYDGAIKAGQSFQYTIDGGKHWISTGIDTSVRGVIVLQDVDLTIGAQDLPPPPPRMGIMEAGPVEDVLTTVQLRLVGADKQEILSATETLVLDRFAEMPDVALVNATASHFGGLGTGNTNVVGFAIDGLEQGAVVQYLYMSPGANMATWTTSLPALQDGMHTVRVRQLDAAGNASEAKEMQFNLNRETPDALTIRLADDTGIDDKDGVTSDGTVIIEGLGEPSLTGWEYSVDDGKTWKFGGVTKDGVEAQLDLGALDIATGALLVRQINYAGNASAASNKLEFTFDDTPPTEILSFQRIEGELDGVLKTDQDKVDLTFGVAHKDDGIVQWRVKGSDTWVDAPQANSNGHFTLQGIDLSEADQTIELRVIDAAGNVGFEDSVVIDGPIGISVEMTPQGLRVTSSTAGTIEIGGVPVESTHETTQAIVGTVLVGQQELARSGVLTVRTADGQVLQDPSGRVYHLGDADADGPQGSYLWGFQGYDHLEGTAGDDYISGGADNDTIYSMGGSDVISGGAESDAIYLEVDGKGSTLVYEAGDTRSTVVVSGDYFNGMDFIFGAEAGDVIQVGDILHGASTVGDTLLTSAAAGQVSVVRSSGDSRFNVNPDGTSFLVQWTDGTAINSIYFKDYAGHALDLAIDAGRGTLTLVDGPVASTYKSITYSFSATDSGFYLDGMPDGIVHSGVGNGLLAGQDFWLENALTSTQADSDYTSGPGFGIGIDGNMHFGRALEAGVYNMSFNKDTFATDSGYLAAGDIMFAGGVAGNIVQDGFSVPTFLPINYTLNDAGSNVSKMYGAYGTAVQLTTGTQQDVILAGGGVQMDIRYGRIDSSAQDMLIGFGGDDQLLFQGVAETTIDKDQNGALDWAWSGTLEAHHEGIAIDIDGVIVTSELDNDDSATLATLRALDVTMLTKRDLVILARDTAADSAILLHYSDSDGNGVINGGEVQVIATFFDGVPLMDEINVVGTYYGQTP